MAHFVALCSCDKHEEWGFRDTAFELKSVTSKERSHLPTDAKHKHDKRRKRKICRLCVDRIALEKKSVTLEEEEVQQSLENEGEEVEPAHEDDVTYEYEEHDSLRNTCINVDQLKETSVKATFLKKPFKDLNNKSQANYRNRVIDELKERIVALVDDDKKDLQEFLVNMMTSKKWKMEFGATCHPNADDKIIENLVQEYKLCKDRVRNSLIMNNAKSLKQRILIGTNDNSRIAKEGTTEAGKTRMQAARDMGRVRTYGDDKRTIMSIVCNELSYREIQAKFGCSDKTITAAKIHRLLFGIGGVAPPNFKFRRERVSIGVVQSLTEFLEQPDVSRPSSCRSVLIDGKETPVRYWQDSIKNVIDQYLIKFPNGVKATYIYTHLPKNFRMNTMLAGLCNLCYDLCHKNFDELERLINEVIIQKDPLLKAVQNGRKFMKTEFSKGLAQHSPCQALCVNYSFGSCNEPHSSMCKPIDCIYGVLQSVEESIGRPERDESIKDQQLTLLQSITDNFTQYMAHLIRTSHQSSYYQYVLESLKEGELLMIIDYKMKIELGLQTRECQRDWYGKRGISFHGCYIIAKVSSSECVHRVIDLWSDDTKQDTFFTQSALDVIYRWISSSFPQFRVYQFSDNGPHYHNSGLICYLSEVNMVFDMTLVEHVFFEAGEGKTILDTHFAHVGHKVTRWVKTGNSLTSGDELSDLVKDIKNTQCQKLVIDRGIAPKKVGTFVNISLYGYFQFSCDSQEVSAQSLAGIGAKVVKSVTQMRALSGRSAPLAGSTGSLTVDEVIPYESQSLTSPPCGMSYSLMFINHDPTSTASPELSNAEIDPYDSQRPQSGFALKKAGARQRVTFTETQKEIMTYFYDRQASAGVTANPPDVIAEMVHRGEVPLTEQQITRWFSSHHRIVRKQMRDSLEVLGSRVAPSTPPSLPTSAPSIPQTTDSPATTPVSCTSTMQQQTMNSPSLTSITQTQASSIPSTPSMSTTSNLPSPASTSSHNSTRCSVGAIHTQGVTIWSFPSDMAQGTIDGRTTGSSACTIIATMLGKYLIDESICSHPPTVLPSRWVDCMYRAIIEGNDAHHDLFGNTPVHLCPDEVYQVLGNDIGFEIDGISVAMYGVTSKQHFKDTLASICTAKERSSYILVTGGRSSLIVAFTNESMLFLDSHSHDNKGSVIVGFENATVHNFSSWFFESSFRIWNSVFDRYTLTKLKYE